MYWKYLQSHEYMWIHKMLNEYRHGERGRERRGGGERC